MPSTGATSETSEGGSGAGRSNGDLHGLGQVRLASLYIQPKLSPARNLLLRTAASRADGRLIPPSLRGGRTKALPALLVCGWIEPVGDGHVLTDAGCAAIRQQRHALSDGIQPVDSSNGLQFLDGISARLGTKLTALVMALRCQSGAVGHANLSGDGYCP